MQVNRLPELNSTIEAEFRGRVEIEIPNLPADAGEAAVYFEPVNPAAASLNIRYSCGNYSISFVNAIALDSNEQVPDDEAFDWTLDQVRRIARFGLVYITTRWFLGLLRGSEYVIPTAPIDSKAFEEELRRRVSPVIQRTWEPW